MIIYMDTKLTANQCAKALIAEKGVIAVDYLSENSSLEYDLLTEKELADLQHRLNVNYDRLIKFFGIDCCGNIIK